jgi:hypothetical protein
MGWVLLGVWGVLPAKRGSKGRAKPRYARPRVAGRHDLWQYCVKPEQDISSFCQILHFR